MKAARSSNAPRGLRVGGFSQQIFSRFNKYPIVEERETRNESKMLVVFEGCDGSGKTTFTEMLRAEMETLGYTVGLWNRGIPTRHPLEEYELDIEKNYDRTDQNHLIICDRLHLGEYVYGPLFRGESKLSLGDLWHVDAFLRARGAIQICMTQPLTTIQSRLTARGEDLLSMENVTHVLTAYDDLISHFRRSIFRFTGDIMTPHITTVMKLASTNAERARNLARFPTYVGPPDPEILLLGETRRLSDARPTHDAAFVPYVDTSGHWLCDAIVNSPLASQNIGIANACEEDVVKLVGTLGMPRIVALGNEATTAVRKTRLHFGAVPHPQYARRFKYGKQHEYAAAIMRAAAEKVKVVPEW
jgi:thymidylate kinase